MKTILLFFIAIAISLSNDFEELYFGTDETLDIMTWNIENFPKNGSITTNYVTEIIQYLNIDVLAIQEVNNITSFNCPNCSTKVNISSNERPLRVACTGCNKVLKIVD